VGGFLTDGTSNCLLRRRSFRSLITSQNMPCIVRLSLNSTYLISRPCSILNRSRRSAFVRRSRAYAWSVVLSSLLGGSVKAQE
jgi:hypothetical protein